MENKAKSIAASKAPWRRGIGWPVVLIEGLVLLGVGIYALTATESARGTIFAIFGAILLGSGAAAIWGAFRLPPARGTAFRALRGGVAVTTGLLALVSRLGDTLDRDDARIILGFGFAVVGLIGLVGVFFTRTERRFPVAALMWQVVTIVIGITVLTGSSDSDGRLDLLGWIATILGILLIGLAVLIQQGKLPTAQAEEEFVVDPIAVA